MTERADLRVVGETTSARPAAAGYDDWMARGGEIVSQRDHQGWSLVDWLRDGDERYPGDGVKAAAERLGISPGKISDFRLLAKVYPEFRRRNSLTFSHHLEVVRLPEAARVNILDEAAAGNWTRNQVREAAHQVSIEARLARAEAERDEYKRRLRVAGADPRDAASQARSRLEAERRVVRDAARRAARIVEELATSEVTTALHGNARRGVVRDIRRTADALVADVNEAIERVETAVAAIGGAVE